MREDATSRRPAPSGPLRWFPEFLDLGRRRLRAQVRLLSSSLLVGVVAGLCGVVFFVACQVVAHYARQGGRVSAPFPGGRAAPGVAAGVGAALSVWLLLVVPTVGGIVSGILVFTVAPEAEGHGRDAVIAAYHYLQGRIRPRVPIVKTIASAITLGSGGCGGREGPIAQIGAGFGSFLGVLLRLRPADRRVLMAAGMGAGVAAIFRAPLAGALFAAEVPYRSPEFEPEVIIPAGLASAVSYRTFGSFFCWQPLFYDRPPYPGANARDRPRRISSRGRRRGGGCVQLACKGFDRASRIASRVRSL